MNYDSSNPHKKNFQVLSSPKPQQNRSPSNPQTNQHNQLSLHKSSAPYSKKIWRPAMATL